MVNTETSGRKVWLIICGVTKYNIQRRLLDYLFEGGREKVVCGLGNEHE